MTLAQRTFAEVEIARSRRHDPETSKTAAAMSHGVAAEHRLLILAAMRDAGCELTATEIGERVGLTSVQVARRLHEMFDDGLIEPTTNTRPTPAGRPSRCWRVCA